MEKPTYEELTTALTTAHDLVLTLKESIRLKSALLAAKQRQLNSLLNTLWLIKPRLPKEDQVLIEQLLAIAQQEETSHV